jgi:hypothetical protein
MRLVSDPHVVQSVVFLTTAFCAALNPLDSHVFVSESILEWEYQRLPQRAAESSEVADARARALDCVPFGSLLKGGWDEVDPVPDVPGARARLGHACGTVLSLLSNARAAASTLVCGVCVW